MEKVEPEHTAREVVDACADCDVCRHLMDSSCLFFPELYRLIDREMDAKEKITPDESFTAWANNHKLNSNPGKKQKRKLAYFAGCTGRYLFPEVPRAAVDVFQKNGIEIYYPEQQCCGMPTLLEGDRQLTLKFVHFNVDRLVEVVEAGYDIVCSCSTCGFMLKNILKEGAYYPPCHLREQKIGRPYAALLGLIPGLNLDPIDWHFYCCGMAGIMGFKREFHKPSIKLGSRLIDKIKALNPERLVTDCLSCRLQFNQLMPYAVYHPIEILNESYANYQA